MGFKQQPKNLISAGTAGFDNANDIVLIKN
jgi:hypothetical protein